MCVRRRILLAKNPSSDVLIFVFSGNIVLCFSRSFVDRIIPATVPDLEGRSECLLRDLSHEFFLAKVLGSVCSKSGAPYIVLF